MSQEQWTAVDRYICDLLIPPDDALDNCLQTSAAAGLPPINVSPNQGKFLHLLAKIRGAKKILEIGTLAGYSTIWLARALSANGKLITLEFDPKHADIAQGNIAHAGLSNVVEIRLGDALVTLPTLAAEAPFDLVFIDADKKSAAEYFQWAVRLTKKEAVIIVDNVVRSGEVVNASSADENVVGIRRFNEVLMEENRVSATAIQTVGSKGYDGFCLILRTE